MKLLIILTLTFFFSCSSLGSVKKRGKLSDAMKAASDENKGSREVEPSDDSCIFSSSDNEGDLSEITIRKQPKKVKTVTYKEITRQNGFKRSLFSLSFGHGGFASNNYTDLSNFEAHFGFGSESMTKKYSEYYLFMGFHNYSVGSLNEHASSYKNPFLFTAGIKYKAYLTPQHTFMGLSFQAGLVYGFQYWEYKNPIYSLGDRISSDSVSGIGLNLGLGFNVIQIDRLTVGADVSWTGFGFSNETNQGFENDTFSTLGFTKYMLTFSVGLGK